MTRFPEVPGRALAVLISIAVLPACDDASVTDAEIDEHCAEAACGDGGCPCATGDAADGGSSDALPETSVIVPPCVVCARAEACCRAQGLTNCSYVAACTSAQTAGQAEFYVVLCRAVLKAASEGPRTLPDVCGF